MCYICSLCLFVLFLLVVACGGPPSGEEDFSPKPENRSESRVVDDQLAHRSDREDKRSAPGEVLVKFKKGTEQPDIEKIQKQLGLETVRVVSQPNLYLMKTEKGQSVQEIVKRLQEFEAVDYAEPNYTRTAQ